MKLSLLAAPLIAVAFCSAPLRAHAECHFSTDLPIVCGAGITAALALEKLGTDDAAIRQSYNQRILHAAGCGTPYDAGKHTYFIELINHGRSATDQGWVPISVIAVDHKGLWYVADAYLSGVCAKYKPDVEIYDEKTNTFHAPGSSSPTPGIP